MVQRASPHTDENLIFTRLGIGDIFVGEDFRPTELMDANGFHGTPASSERNLTFQPSINALLCAGTTAVGCPVERSLTPPGGMFDLPAHPHHNQRYGSVRRDRSPTKRRKARGGGDHCECAWLHPFFQDRQDAGARRWLDCRDNRRRMR